MAFSLLAGPIVRRADPGRVCIWFATKDPAAREVRLYRAADVSGSPIGVARGRTVRLGQGLHVHLAQVRPSQGGDFPVEELLSYDIVDIESPQQDSLRQVAVDQGLVYAPFRLPTFYLQGKQPLRAIYTSCRKLHGPAPDAMREADDVLAKTARDVTARPNVLFLGGDQIYADDVADELIGPLSALGEQLAGRFEKIPMMPKPPHEYAPGKRQQAAKYFLRFTSGEAGNHLMTFGEYAAMYLLAWNDQMWPARPQPSLQTGQLSGPPKAMRLTPKHPSLGEYPGAIRNVRRVLANTPTYMMFDDHDVTDDWNISRLWSEQMYMAPAGRRVVANALAAYWAFQGWGNDPESGSDSFIRALEGHLAAAKPTEAAGEAFDKALHGFGDWSVYAPTNPPSYLLDCRSLRMPNSSGSTEPPAILVNTAVWAQAAERIKRAPGYRPGGPIVLLAPAPVFGVQHIESLQKFVIGTGAQSVYDLDLESWSAEPRNIVNLVDFLRQLKPDPCVIVSGDVHYGATASITITMDPLGPAPALRETIRIAQFTSSAAKNSSGPLKYLATGLNPAALAMTYYWREDGGKPTVAHGPKPAAGKPNPDWLERFQLAGGHRVMLPENNVGLLEVDGHVVRNHYRTAGGKEHFATDWDSTSESWPSG